MGLMESLKTKEIKEEELSLTTEKMQLSSIAKTQDTNIKTNLNKLNIQVDEAFQLIKEIPKFKSTSIEGKKVQEVYEKVIDLSNIKDRTIEQNKQFLVFTVELQKIEYEKLEKREREVYEILRKGLEDANKLIMQNYLGVSNSKINDVLTSKALNNIINELSIKTMAEQKSYEKVAEDIYRTWENMRDYLKNPAQDVKISDNEEVQKTEDSLCKLYYTEKAMNYHLEKNNNNDYNKALKKYFEYLEVTDATYVNKKGNKVTTKVKEFLAESKIKTPKGREMSALKYSTLTKGIPTLA